MEALNRAEFLGMAGSLLLPEQRARKQRGAFVFFHNGIFETTEGRAAEIERLAKFRVCLTNGYANFEGDDLGRLKTAGCELFLYLWFNGYYERELARGPEPVYIQGFPEVLNALRGFHAHPKWLLNPEQPIQGSGAVLPAFFYDFASLDFRRAYTEFIARYLVRTGYSRVFFDYLGSWALPDGAKEAFRQKHPGKNYDAESVRFLRELRQAVPAIRIFGNQAYRMTPEYYELIDYDLTESHATSFVWGKQAKVILQDGKEREITETFYRLWDGAAGYKEISKQRRERMRMHPAVQVFDLNYLQPRYVRDFIADDRFRPVTDRPAIFYGYVMGKLTGVESSSSDWYARGYRSDELSFLDLGAPATPAFTETETAVVRYFENGFVVATRQAANAKFRPDPAFIERGTVEIEDVYERKKLPVRNRTVTVQIRPAEYPATGSVYPSGRVYLYHRKRTA